MWLLVPKATIWCNWKQLNIKDTILSGLKSKNNKDDIPD